LKTLALFPLLLLVSGCATENSVKMARIAKEAYGIYQAQPRTYSAVTMKGSNITITGVNELVMEAPLNPLEAMPKDSDTVGKIVDGVKNTALGITGIYGLTAAATREPTVVAQPQPLIVRPEVVQTGGQ
jgi:hypothetical protein